MSLPDPSPTGPRELRWFCPKCRLCMFAVLRNHPDVRFYALEMQFQQERWDRSHKPCAEAVEPKSRPFKLPDLKDPDPMAEMPPVAPTGNQYAKWVEQQKEGGA